MAKDQNADHAYLAAKLIRLLIRRHNLPANSDQIPALICEIVTVESLIHSYRMVKEPGA